VTNLRDAILAADMDAFKELLADDVVWIGVRPRMLCRTREEVVAMLDQPDNDGRTFAPEIVADREGILVVDPHPSPPPEQLPTVHQVLVVDEGRVLEMRDYADRESALDALEPLR
jgi:ketosteroid isomerase-like protein